MAGALARHLKSACSATELENDRKQQALQVKLVKDKKGLTPDNL
jgi:hypothetical protein